LDEMLENLLIGGQPELICAKQLRAGLGASEETQVVRPLWATQ